MITKNWKELSTEELKKEQTRFLIATYIFLGIMYWVGFKGFWFLVIMLPISFLLGNLIVIVRELESRKKK
jgi:hypothetical protein